MIKPAGSGYTALTGAAERSDTELPMEDETTQIYARVGDDEPFHALVEAFYRGVEADPILRPLYPADLTHAKLHLVWFLIQRFGGPLRYQEERGHPRLRMRHLPFQIGRAESTAWLRHMSAAVEAVPAFSPFRDVMGRYFSEAAAFLINHGEIPAIADS